MNRHTESVFFFGYVVPFLLAAALVGGILYGRARLQKTEAKRGKAWEEYITTAREGDSIEAQLGTPGRRAMMKYWDECLSKEFVQNLTQNLNDIQRRFTEDQLQQTELGRPAGRSGLAGNSENPYTRFKISFNGGFGPVQLALAELERRMPQIVLDDIKITTKSKAQNGAAILNIEATYVSWQDKKVR